MTFKAVKGRKNGLIGLRMLPGPSVVGPEMQPLALMAEGDDGEEVPPWRSSGASSPRDRSRSATTRITTGTMDVPGVQDLPEKREEFQIVGDTLWSQLQVHLLCHLLDMEILRL